MDVWTKNMQSKIAMFQHAIQQQVIGIKNDCFTDLMNWATEVK